MNKKIKQLAVEAGLYVEVKGEPWPRNMAGEDVEGAYQRFAHLVVQECIKLNKQELSFVEYDVLFNRYEEHFGAEHERQRYEFQAP